MGYLCMNCGLPIKEHTEVISETRVFCRACASAFGTCAMCIHRQECEFKTNPDSMPMEKVVTIPMEGITMQRVIPNPDRIIKFCEHCECFSKEYGCLKQFGTCKKYEEIVF